MKMSKSQGLLKKCDIVTFLKHDFWVCCMMYVIIFARAILSRIMKFCSISNFETSIPADIPLLRRISSIYDDAYESDYNPLSKLKSSIWTLE